MLYLVIGEKGTVDNRITYYKNIVSLEITFQELLILTPTAKLIPVHI